METIATLDAKKPYCNAPLKVFLIAVGDVLQYTKNNKINYRVADIAIADTTEVKKASFYGDSYGKLKVKKCFILKNYVMKEDNTLVLTRSTRMIPAGKMSAEIEQQVSKYQLEGQAMVMTTHAAVAQIEIAKKSPLKSSVTIVGQVQQVSVINKVAGVEWQENLMLKLYLKVLQENAWKKELRFQLCSLFDK